ncbi:MAG: ankyrin repeat domain-containing protein, partial [Endozoicomonadaceae bacterium]|nr:ankyrin repeat domain-containing protein [Endozoicomonadaceae bacterium]
STTDSPSLQPKKSRSNRNSFRHLGHLFRSKSSKSDKESQEILNACLTGDVKIIKKAIKKGFNFNKRVEVSEEIQSKLKYQNDIDFTPKDIEMISYLGVAILSDQINIVKRLASNEAVNLNQSVFEYREFNSLILAVILNKKEMVYQILSKGTNRKTNKLDLYVTDDKYKWTAPFFAVYYDFSGTFNELKPYYCNDKTGLNDLKLANGYNLLHFATVHGSAFCFALLLSSHYIDRDATTNIGETALHLAAAEGRKDFVKWLIKSKCDLNPKIRNTRLRLTPLATAILNNINEDYEDIIEKFLENPMIDIESAIHVAMENHCYDLFDKLIKHTNLKVNSSDTKDGAKIIDRAILLGDSYMLQRICKIEGLNPNLATYKGYLKNGKGKALAPIHLAVMMKKLNILDTLSCLPIDVYKEASKHKTAFDLIKRSNPNAEEFKHLLGNMAEKNSKLQRISVSRLNEALNPESMTVMPESLNDKIDSIQDDNGEQSDFIDNDSSENRSGALMLFM